MSEQEPRFQQVTQTTIDLKIIQQQLDTVESALLMAWRSMQYSAHSREQDQQVSDAIDALLAVKKSLRLTSDLLPVEEQQNATTVEYVMMPLEWRPKDE